VSSSGGVERTLIHGERRMRHDGESNKAQPFAHQCTHDGRTGAAGLESKGAGRLAFFALLLPAEKKPRARLFVLLAFLGAFAAHASFAQCMRAEINGETKGEEVYNRIVL
jgi:hypothetical protein